MTRVVFHDEVKTNTIPLTGQGFRIFGEYHLFPDLIVVWMKGLTPSEQTRVLAHELQHAKDRRLLLFTYVFVVLVTGIGAFLLAGIVCIGLPMLLGPYMWYPMFTSVHYSDGLVDAVCRGLMIEVFLFVVCCELHRWTEARAKRAASTLLAPRMIDGGERHE